MTINPKELLERQKSIMNSVGYRSGVGTYTNPGTGMPVPKRLEPNGQTPPIQELLVEEVKELCRKKLPMATVIPPPGAKGFERASQKVQDKLQGNWRLLNDLNRCTVVMPEESGINTAVNVLIGAFQRYQVGKGLQLIFQECKQIRPKDPGNPCAYSHAAVILRTPDFKRAEIQVNYPEMMYAKSLPEFQETFGWDLVRAMRTRFAPVPGGLGHAMYETWRTQQTSWRGKDHAAACKLYYEYFRSKTPTSAMAEAVLNAVYPLHLNVPGIVVPPRHPFRSA